MDEKVRQAPDKLARRKELAEHPFGTLKWLLPGGFLLKGLVKVGAEVSLVHFAYNFKRVLAILGMEELMEALKEWQDGQKGARKGLPGRISRLIGGLIPQRRWERWSSWLFGESKTWRLVQLRPA